MMEFFLLQLQLQLQLLPIQRRPLVSIVFSPNLQWSCDGCLPSSISTRRHHPCFSEHAIDTYLLFGSIKVMTNTHTCPYHCQKTRTMPFITLEPVLGLVRVAIHVPLAQVRTLIHTCEYGFNPNPVASHRWCQSHHLSDGTDRHMHNGRNTVFTTDTKVISKSVRKVHVHVSYHRFFYLLSYVPIELTIRNYC